MRGRRELGNAYGVSAIVEDGPPNEDALTLARYQAGRVVAFADAPLPTRSARHE